MTARDRKRHLDDIQEEARLDMTPMIDVVFLLIIFFLCIDFRILEAKLPAYLPRDLGSMVDNREPLEQLRVGILLDSWGKEMERPWQATTKAHKAYWLDGHRVHYMVGPRPVDSLAELRAELARLAADSWVTDPATGQRRRAPVVVEPGSGTVYADVAPCVDTILATGFDDIRFGGGLGPRHGSRRPQGQGHPRGR
jgi:biopolymer transport protein ExbD